MRPGEHASRNLQALRTEARLSQKEFLARLGRVGIPMDQSTLSKKERGDRALNTDELLRFSAVLDVSPLELLLPRTEDEDLQLSSSVTLPAARARAWIRGWRRLNYFDGVPDSALTLPDQEARNEIERLVAEIDRIDTEISIREDLIREAEATIDQLSIQPTLYDTPESNLAGEPFERWIERARDALQQLAGKREELRRELLKAERDAQDRGWLHRDPSARSL